MESVPAHRHLTTGSGIRSCPSSLDGQWNPFLPVVIWQRAVDPVPSPFWAGRTALSSPRCLIGHWSTPRWQSRDIREIHNPTQLRGHDALIRPSVMWVILPAVATPSGLRPLGVATSGKITHRPEDHSQTWALCPRNCVGLRFRQGPHIWRCSKRKALAMAKCRNVHHKLLFFWSGLSTFMMKVFKYSEGSSNVSSTSNMITDGADSLPSIYTATFEHIFVVKTTFRHIALIRFAMMCTLQRSSKYTVPCCVCAKCVSYKGGERDWWYINIQIRYIHSSAQSHFHEAWYLALTLLQGANQLPSNLVLEVGVRLPNVSVLQTIGEQRNCFYSEFYALSDH